MVPSLSGNVKARCCFPPQSKRHCQHAQTTVDGLRSWTIESLDLAEGCILAQVGALLCDLGAYIDAVSMGVGGGVVQLFLPGLASGSTNILHPDDSEGMSELPFCGLNNI